ncbi:MAG: FAD-dependent oxidoreductase [Rhodobacteraceae bacterium]|nr:FAD-dependent oxidoreductase [Paracoccaceae bacterium]
MTGGFDLVVIGGGIIGCAAAWGAASAGGRVAVVDGGDADDRASNGNFGLLWTQGKGVDAPPYAAWTRRSAHLWPEFAAALAEASGIDFGFEQKGGLHFVLSADEAARRMAALAPPGSARDDFAVEFLPAADLGRDIPGLGPEVFGATFCPRDGAVNPLRLLQALRGALARANVAVFQGRRADGIRATGGGFAVSVGERQLSGARLLLAAGLANRELGRGLGLELALFPQRGQLLVTERTPPFLPWPGTAVRQMPEGTVLLGSTQENVGFDKSVGVAGLAGIAQRALRLFPHLGGLALVRSWACLRVMTPDGLPIYEESPRFPGAFAAAAHSGITLAAVHARVLAPAILAGGLPADVASFAAGRFADWQPHDGGPEH